MSNGLLIKCMGCDLRGTKRCTRCKKAWYCSIECQRTDWTLHHSKVCTQTATVAIRILDKVSEYLNKKWMIEPLLTDIVQGLSLLVQGTRGTLVVNVDP